MKSSDLRSRLDAIKKKDSSAYPEEKKKSESIPLSEQSLQKNGWSKISDMVYEKISLYNNPLSDSVSDFLMPETSETSRLIFYDTETTGLSGGAGNIVFLAGFGQVVNGKFKIVQIMLTDFPGEPAFLNEIDKYISPDRIYVSYNGRSFDANILKSRHSMNGLKAEFGYQLDLLYPSRRLWKNIIGSCSLGDIEKHILKKGRELDVPGSMVPDLYFDFIRSGKYQLIEAVAAHHLEDICSLAELLSLFENIFENPVSYKMTDRVGLSIQLMGRHEVISVNVLKAGFNEGNYRAGKELGLYYKRIKNYTAAVDVWKRMWLDRKSIFAGIELAKYYEHRQKDADKALQITDEILSFDRIRIRSILPELDKRKNRLEKKLIKTN